MQHTVAKDSNGTPVCSCGWTPASSIIVAAAYGPSVTLTLHVMMSRYLTRGQ